MSGVAESDAVGAARARYLRAVRDVAALAEMESFAGGRVCVAGFTGQVGSALVRVLLEANRTTLAEAPAQITGVARRPRAAAPDGVTPVYADVADESVLPHDFTHVFYAVGVTSDYRSRPRDVIDSQLVGLETFLEAVDPACRFVFVSSARVYGRRTTDEALSEDSPAVVVPMHLDNLYDSAKRLAESLCLSHADRRGLKVTVVRPGNLYGLDAPGSATSVSEFVREAAESGRVTLEGNLSSVRNYCCTVDLAQALVRAAHHEADGRAYNVGSHEHLTTRELAQAVADCFDGPIEIALPDEPDPPSHQRLSLDAAARQLGYAPTLAVRDVLPAVAAEISAELAARGVALRARPA